MSHLKKSINYYHDGISSPLHTKKSLYKIHRNICPAMFRNGEGTIESGVLTLSLVFLVNFTSVYKILHIFLELGPNTSLIS